jgi:hypothetical protein
MGVSRPTDISFPEKNAIDMVYIMINNWIVEAMAVQMTNQVKR